MVKVEETYRVVKLPWTSRARPWTVRVYPNGEYHVFQGDKCVTQFKNADSLAIMYTMLLEQQETA